MSLQQLSHVDAAFLSFERPNTPMHTAGVVIFDGMLPFQRVYETIEERLHLVPRFTQKVAQVPFGIGRPFWVNDDHFDLSFHLRHAALPAPGTDEQLCDYAARLISRPLDRSRPLWEIYVIEGLEDGRSAMVAKTHHVMVDGMSSMDLATVLFDFGAELQRFDPHPQAVAKATSTLDLTVEAAKRQARDLIDLGRSVAGAVMSPRRVVTSARTSAGAVVSAATSILRPASRSPLNVGPGLHRRYAVVRSTLQTFKDIKNAADSTVNDVVLAVCADALGKLFRSRGERTEGTTLRVLVPVSVRSESKKMALGNELTPIFPELPIGKMKPLDRLRIIHDQMDDIKESKRAVGADLLVNITRWAPPTLHAMAARAGVRGRWMNTVISNVPGPQIPLYSCGIKMLEPYPVIPLAQGQSLSIGVTSYLGGIFFGLNADRDAHADLQQLARYVDESILELEKAAGERGSVTKAKTEIAVGTGEPPS